MMPFPAFTMVATAPHLHLPSPVRTSDGCCAAADHSAAAPQPGWRRSSSPGQNLPARRVVSAGFRSWLRRRSTTGRRSGCRQPGSERHRRPRRHGTGPAWLTSSTWRSRSRSWAKRLRLGVGQLARSRALKASLLVGGESSCSAGGRRHQQRRSRPIACLRAVAAMEASASTRFAIDLLEQALRTRTRCRKNPSAP